MVSALNLNTLFYTKSTQRRENTKNMLNKMLTKMMYLVRFVKHYEATASNWRENENKLDHSKVTKYRPLKTIGC